MKSRILAAALVAASTLPACYTCNFEVDGACVAYHRFDPAPGDEALWREGLGRSLAFWGLHDLDGWTVVVHRGSPSWPLCYGDFTADGCTLPFVREIHVNVHPCPTWYVAHELGHVRHGDPFHALKGWDELSTRQWHYSACGAAQEEALILTPSR